MDEQQHTLALGLQQGRPEAWQALYDQYAAQVWRAVARLLTGSNDVADVVQETFLAAARSARSYDPARGTPWMWLWGIARRHVALHLRKQSRLPVPTLDGAARAELLGREGVPIEALTTAELAQRVRATLAELPLEYESVLTARYLDGQSVDQIAEREQASEGAIRSRLARAKQAFRAAFEKCSLALGASARTDHDTAGR